MSCSICAPFQEEQEFVKWLHAILGHNLEHLRCEIMLVKNEFFPEESIEQPKHEEHVGRVSRVNCIKAMPKQHLKAQVKRHEHGKAVLHNVANVFVPRFR